VILMALDSAVFVSSLSATDWERDTDPPGEVHLIGNGIDMEAGLWRSVPGFTPEPVHWTLPDTEVILVLEGQARIEIEGGPVLELKPGDIATMPKGAVTTWHLTRPFKEFWVLA
jgi:uncharacterized cupin superfamily protein